MELSYEFALIIDEKLREMGYPRNISLSSKEFKIFKIEDLNKIKSLSITNASNIDEIGCLQNLIKLKIEGIDFNSIKDDPKIEEELAVVDEDELADGYSEDSEMLLDEEENIDDEDLLLDDEDLLDIDEFNDSEE